MIVSVPSMIAALSGKAAGVHSEQVKCHRRRFLAQRRPRGHPAGADHIDAVAGRHRVVAPDR